jgi:HEAT repeat protein
MNTIDQWLELYMSEDPAIRVRAAQGLLNRGDEIPLPVLLNILDSLCDQGLGAATEKVLKSRRDEQLTQEMISRLSSANHFIREVACEVLGSLGDRVATSQLLERLNDPYLMVRRAAALALGSLKDPASVSELKRQYLLQQSDLNMELAIGSALKELGVEI